ncbi:MAG: carbohydrate ABC transporter permease [Alphaproteobacteria bacterium]|nr:carbohydrate ABC transporter permease [Alphaproteobacteria bacterium]
MSSAAVPSAPRRPRLRRRTAVQSGRYAIAVLLTLVVVFPTYWLCLMAFKSAEEMFAVPPVYFPSEPTFESFRVLFRGEDAATIGNSLIIATVTTLFCLVLGTMCAYSMARFRTGGHDLAVWIMSQRMLPPIAIVFPMFLAFALLDLVDSFPALILVYIAFNLPFTIWMMRGYIEDIPIELEESALVDGCTRWQVLYKVILPMARAGLFATGVFTFIFTWNEFAFALVLTSKSVVTFPVQVVSFFGMQATFWNKVGSMSILGSLPVMFAVVFLQRFLVRGISMGALKG